MCHYHHLTLSAREKILFFRAKSYSITQIAAELGCHPATISRELRRNTVQGTYLPVTVHEQYTNCRASCKPYKRLEDASLYAMVKDLFFIHHWSSAEIAGRLRLKHHQCIIS